MKFISESDIDLDDNIYAVALRASRHLGEEVALRHLDPHPAGCRRSEANNRIFLRRWACAAPEPGKGFSYMEHIHLIDLELKRMGVPLEEYFGCRRKDCLICNPPRTCRRPSVAVKIPELTTRFSAT